MDKNTTDIQNKFIFKKYKKKNFGYAFIAGSSSSHFVELYQ